MAKNRDYRRLIRAAVERVFADRVVLSDEVLLPAWVQIYVPQEACSEIIALSPHLCQQIHRALDAEMEARNGLQSGWRRFIHQLEGGLHRRVDAEWRVDFYPDLDQGANGHDYRILTVMTATPEPIVSGAFTVTASRGSSQTTQVAAGGPPEGGEVLAILAYNDRSGRRDFSMRKREVVVGRGGDFTWVDVALEAGPDVSREHLRVRAQAPGSLEVCDISRNKTWTPVAPLPPGIWTPLAFGARLSLGQEVWLEAREAT